MDDVILYFSYKYFGDWERIYDALEKQEDINFEEIIKIKEKYKNKYITILSNEYPLELKQIEKPPFVLFYKGNLSLLKNKKKIWYFGSYIKEKEIDILFKHKKDLNINNLLMITGYTNEFERKLLNNIENKNMIIIRDSGIDSYINMTKIEEKSFIKNNLIISEYPDKVIPSLYTWESSNRIKIGLTKGIFLLNTLKEKMMFKIIADTIDENKDVFCYDGFDDGKTHNNILINKGAKSIKKIKELV